MEGDCQDYTVALCSMYLSLGLQAAVVRVEDRSGSGHILPLVRHPNVGFEKYCDLIKLYYYREGVLSKSIDVAVDETELGDMVVAGSTGMKRVGDVEGLISTDWAYQERDSWNWVNKTRQTVFEPQ